MPNRYQSPSLQTIFDAEFSPINASKVEQEMHTSLWRAIFEGKLKPGTKLREDTIGETFSVSRTIVRKVLLILEQENLVSLPQNHGAFIFTPSKKQANDCLEAIRMFCLHVAGKLSSENSIISQRDKGLIEAHIEYQRRSEDDGDLVLARQLSREFHILLACVHSNGVIVSKLANLLAQLSLIMSLFSQAGQLLPARANFQERLYKHILDHDVKKACQLIDDLYDTVQRLLSLQQDDNENDLKNILLQIAQDKFDAAANIKSSRVRLSANTRKTKR